MGDTMQLWNILQIAIAQANATYEEFLRVPAMSMGIYKLPAGGTDPQSPHTEDEAYYVVSGRANFVVEGETKAISPGMLLFVPAHADHRFKDITEDLTLLVFFAPPEGSHTVAG
ncbi:MAG: cupin domain-containing protein [Aggregatilineales bacterium]